MRKTFFLTFTISILYASSQSFYHSNYTWEKDPKVYSPTDAERKHDLVIVSEKKINEVVYEADGQAVIYETIHNIYHVNSVKAIDGVNKGYIPQSGVLEDVELKARCITPENKEIYFNTSSLKSVDNYEDAGAYKIFAIDGVDVGCDVEILYTNKKQFHAYGYNYIQSVSPIRYLEYRIISPKNLVYETATYNGLEGFKTETSDSLKNNIYIIQKNIAALEKEKYSAEKANYMSLLYQLAYNTDRKKSKIQTWDIISRDYYTSVYLIEKEESKMLNKIMSKCKISRSASTADKAAAFDSYFKTNFEINGSYGDLSFTKAMDTHKMGYSNGIKFYIGGLKYLGIQFELVIAPERTDITFDQKFASYIFMKEYMIYYPETDQYVSPLSIYSRYGFPTPEMLCNEGLFIKEVNIGEIFTSSAKTKTITSTDYKNSYHNTDVKASLDFETKTVSIDVTHSLRGYNAYYLQPIYRYLTDEQKEEVHKNYHLSENGEGVKNFKIEGVAEEDVLINPMIVKFNAEQNDFLENAGNKFIFKAGMLIGTQAELYQEETRKWPAEMNYTHYLKRILEINVPIGYKPTNLNDLVIDKRCVLDGKEIAIFKSSFEVKNDKILIDVYEDYQVIDYPLSIFESFKAVINAAADFNKKSIIFEKQ